MIPYEHLGYPFTLLDRMMLDEISQLLGMGFILDIRIRGGGSFIDTDQRQ